MKISLTFFITLISISLFATDVVSTVDRVTVFLNQAEVHRVAKTNIDAYTSELVFTGLSNQLDQNSIQVKGKGDFVILGTSYRYNYLTGEESSKTIKELKELIESRNRRISDLSAKLSVLDAEEDLLKANKVIGGGESHVTASELKAMADFYSNRLFVIHQERYVAKLDKEKEQKDLQQLQNQLNQENSKEQKVSGEIVVEISNRKTQPIELELKYLVRGASWNPSYDLRADKSLDDLDLIYKATVTQSTGEKWENVKLSLSTNSPTNGASIPKLSPWYLDFAREIQFRNKQASMRSDALMSSAPMMEIADEDVVAYNMVSINEGLLAVNYEVGLPATIKSGSKPTIVSIRIEKLSADFVYQSVPRVSEKVFLVAKTKDWKSMNLMPGHMNVFYDGGFINKTYVNPSQELDDFNISFGIDQSVTIDHKAVREFTDDQTLGSKRKVDFEYEIKVVNSKPKTISMEVFDQLPISKNDDIEVNDIELNGGILNRNSGEIKWAFDLSSVQSKHWDFRYQVRYPRDQRINGL